jgi:hypothetical protein
VSRAPLEGNPLEDGAVMEHVRLVMKAGMVREH